MSVLDRAIGNAVSFPGSRPPEPARCIGQIERPDGNYVYFQGQSGKFYYGTESGIAFARQMEAAGKKRRTKK